MTATFHFSQGTAKSVFAHTSEAQTSITIYMNVSDSKVRYSSALSDGDMTLLRPGWGEVQ